MRGVLEDAWLCRPHEKAVAWPRREGEEER